MQHGCPGGCYVGLVARLAATYEALSRSVVPKPDCKGVEIHTDPHTHRLQVAGCASPCMLSGQARSPEATCHGQEAAFFRASTGPISSPVCRT